MITVANIAALANDVVKQAYADVSQAPLIFHNASMYFQQLAVLPENAPIAPLLRSNAAEFARAVTQFQMLLPEPPQPAMIDAASNVAPEAVAPNQVALSSNIVSLSKETINRVTISPAGLDNPNTVLGRTFDIKYNPTQQEQDNGIMNNVTVIYWKGSKHESQSMTVDLAMFDALPPEPTGNFSIRPFGRVQYGADGTYGQAKFDINRGTRFTVIGDYISVSIGMDAPRPTYNSAVRTIGGSLGFFAAPSLAPVTLTQYIDDLANPGGVASFPIPTRATAILPIQSSDPDFGLLSLLFFELGGGIITRLNIPAGSQISPIPLTPDMAFMQVINNSPGPYADPVIQVRIPFQLNL